MSWGENYAGSSGLASPKLFSAMHFMEDNESTAQAVRSIFLSITAVVYATVLLANILISVTFTVQFYSRY